jgi:hypothetical protein
MGGLKVNREDSLSGFARMAKHFDALRRYLR